MIWEHKLDATPGDTKQVTRFALFPLKVRLRDSRLVTLWLERYVVTMAYKDAPEIICREPGCYSRRAHWCKPQYERLQDALLRKLNGGSA